MMNKTCQSKVLNIVLEKVILPIPGKWTFETTEDGGLQVTSETDKPIQFWYDLAKFTLSPSKGK